MAIPPHVYKYRSISKNTGRIIRENELYFSSPLGFNDPFEGRVFPDFNGTEAQHRKFYEAVLLSAGFSGAQLQDKIEEYVKKQLLMDAKKAHIFSENTTTRIMERISTLCFSEKRDDILEWSHYGDEHKGICLEFSTSDLSSYLSKLRKVVYSNSYPQLMMFSDPNEEKIKKFILTKSDHWTYESEWRVFEVMGDGFTRRPGAYEFPPDSLTGIIFGCRIPPSERTKVISWLAGRSSMPKLYQAVVKYRDFGLDIVPYSPDGNDLHPLISYQAYGIWLERERDGLDGDALNDWLTAERQVKAILAT